MGYKVGNYILFLWKNFTWEICAQTFVTILCAPTYLNYFWDCLPFFWNFFFCLILKRLNVNFSPYRAERVREVGIKKGNVKNKKKMFYFKQKKSVLWPEIFYVSSSGFVTLYGTLLPSQRLNASFTKQCSHYKKSYLTTTVRAA
jgi:hypothetical protein